MDDGTLKVEIEWFSCSFFFFFFFWLAQQSDVQQQ
jgi:hypothetical protein